MTITVSMSVGATVQTFSIADATAPEIIAYAKANLNLAPGSTDAQAVRAIFQSMFAGLMSNVNSYREQLARSAVVIPPILTYTVN